MKYLVIIANDIAGVNTTRYIRKMGIYEDQYYIKRDGTLFLIHHVSV